jgi:hypothetical protein
MATGQQRRPRVRLPQRWVSLGLGVPIVSGVVAVGSGVATAILASHGTGNHGKPPAPHPTVTVTVSTSASPQGSAAPQPTVTVIRNVAVGSSGGSGVWVPIAAVGTAFAGIGTLAGVFGLGRRPRGKADTMAAPAGTGQA